MSGRSVPIAKWAAQRRRAPAVLLCQ